MRNRIAVIAAHPDDEVLGCGGTMAKHSLAGDEVFVLIMGKGVLSRVRGQQSEERSQELAELAKAAQTANQILGVTSLIMKDFPDNRFDAVDLLEMIRVIEDFIQEVQPIIVYTHHAGDLNIDHRRIHQAVVTSCRPIPGHSVTQLLFFEVASSSEWQPVATAPAFVPNWFVDISNTLDSKLEAMLAYRSEIRQWPHARSMEALEHLARWRGASVGVQAAEAFILGRKVIF